MYAIKHPQLGWVIAWWIALITLAGWLSLFAFSSPVQGDSPAAVGAGPRIEPTVAQHWAIAVDDYRCGDFNSAGDALDKALAAMRADRADDRAMQTWRAIIAQARGELDRAITQWHALELPSENEVWRRVALGAAYLEQGNLEAASLALDTASKADPRNPVVSYFTALLHLEEAEHALDWPDAVGGRPTQWASFTRPTIVPNTASMHRLAAAMEFENAVTRSDVLKKNTPLVPTSWTNDPSLQPVVADLLVALGADHYEANSHHILGHLFLDRENPKAAEGHLDEAYDLGAAILFGYDELGDWYADHDRPLDAGRVYAKSLRAAPHHGSSGVKLLENLGHALREMWRP